MHIARDVTCNMYVCHSIGTKLTFVDPETSTKTAKLVRCVLLHTTVSFSMTVVSPSSDHCPVLHKGYISIYRDVLKINVVH